MNPPSSNDQTAHLGPDFLYFLHAPSLASGGSFFDNPVKTEHSLTKREQAASTGDLRRNPEQYREADGLTWPGFLMLENPHDVCLDSSLHPFKAKAAEAAVELELSRRCSGRHLPCVRGNSLRGGTAEGAVPGTVVAALPLEVQAAVKRYECGRGAPWNDGPQGSLLKDYYRSSAEAAPSLRSSNHWQSAQGALSAPATTQKAESAFAFLDGRASAQYFNAALMQKISEKSLQYGRSAKRIQRWWRRLTGRALGLVALLTDRDGELMTRWHEESEMKRADKIRLARGLRKAWRKHAEKKRKRDALFIVGSSQARLIKAATQLQAAWRGRKGRDRARKVRAQRGTALPTHGRNARLEERRQEAQLKRNRRAAALKIQTAYRGYRVRSRAWAQILDRILCFPPENDRERLSKECANLKAELEDLERRTLNFNFTALPAKPEGPSLQAQREVEAVELLAQRLHRGQAQARLQLLEQTESRQPKGQNEGESADKTKRPPTSHGSEVSSSKPPTPGRQRGARRSTETAKPRPRVSEGEESAASSNQRRASDGSRTSVEHPDSESPPLSPPQKREEKETKKKTSVAEDSAADMRARLREQEEKQRMGRRETLKQRRRSDRSRTMPSQVPSASSSTPERLPDTPAATAAENSGEAGGDEGGSGAYRLVVTGAGAQSSNHPPAREASSPQGVLRTRRGSLLSPPPPNFLSRGSASDDDEEQDEEEDEEKGRGGGHISETDSQAPGEGGGKSQDSSPAEQPGPRPFFSSPSGFSPVRPKVKPLGSGSAQASPSLNKKERGNAKAKMAERQRQMREQMQARQRPPQRTAHEAESTVSPAAPPTADKHSPNLKQENEPQGSSTSNPPSQTDRRAALRARRAREKTM